MTVRPGTQEPQQEAILHGWYRELLHEVIPPMIAAWEERLGVSVAKYFLQRMKTKWGGCQPSHRHIRLNTELAKKPKDLVEYVIVHELTHLLEPTHNQRF